MDGMIVEDDMNTTIRICASLACLVGALAAYSAGIQGGVILFVIAGVLLEGGFWWLLLRKSKNSKSKRVKF